MAMDSLSEHSASAKLVQIGDEGVSLYSDYSKLTIPQAIKDQQFWHILTMVTLSISSGFFTKVTFKSYGSIQINDDIFLTQVAIYGFVTAASSRFLWPFLQGIVGFKTVYTIILCI
jgi:hypothetical protein